MYMTVKGLINVPICSSLLVPVFANTRGHSQRFCQLPMRILCFYHSFVLASIKIWNSLPLSVIDYDSLDRQLLIMTLWITSNMCYAYTCIIR